ncbi:MAG: hypothetical protein JSV88_07925 [Candidatus Aminicenantes bacterium]|nr:MAG: hypothetical protein JSV88_07925 [Candidatus Aminicenantes bacterium]
MIKTIYIVDYKTAHDPKFNFRGERLAKIINQFTDGNRQPFKAKFFHYTRDLPWKQDETNKDVLAVKPFLLLLHKSNQLLPEETGYYSKLADFCKKKEVPVIVYTGENTHGPDQVSADRLKSRLEQVLKKLPGKKEKIDIERTVVDIVNKKSLQVEIVNFYFSFIKPQLSLLKFILEGFLILHQERGFELKIGNRDLILSTSRAAGSKWSWFSPLLSDNRILPGDQEDFTSFCRLFTTAFDLKLTRLYCLLWAEKSGLTDESLAESLEIAFGNSEKDKVKAINQVTGKEYKDLEEILQKQQSIGKMLVKNAKRYSVPLLINPKSPPLLPMEKKYLESFIISDGNFKSAFLNLWSEEVKLQLSPHVNSKLNHHLREFLLEIYQKGKIIRKGFFIKDIDDFKKRLIESNNLLTRITVYFENILGEYLCNTTGNF